MKFSSESEAREFYKNYAEKIGFTVRKGKVQKNVNGQVTVSNYVLLGPT